MGAYRQQQRQMYTFAQISEKPVGITLPRRKVPDGPGYGRRPGAGGKVASCTTGKLGDLASDDEDDALLTAARAIPPVTTDPGSWTSQELIAWLKRANVDADLIDTLSLEVRDPRGVLE